jgi:hypothetical protein
MTKLSKAIVAAAAGIVLLTAAAGPVLAQDAAEPEDATPHMQPAHMAHGHGGAPGHGGGSAASSYGAAPCLGSGAGVGPGMMGPGSMMGHRTMGHGMMAQGMMGHGMMGHGMMAQETMGHGMMGHGMWGGGYGHGSADGKSAIQPDQDLSVDDVRARIERSLKWHGNERLKVGEVKVLDDDTIVAEIVTLDDSLVDRLEVNRHSGSMRRTE